MTDSTARGWTVREADRIVESLRLGIPPDGHLREFTVGRGPELARLTTGLTDPSAEPMSLLVHANYGAGKTHLLKLIREVALEADFAVAMVTVDSKSGVRFNRMDQVCAAVMRSVEVPGRSGSGVGTLFDSYLGMDESVLCEEFVDERRRISANGRWDFSDELGSPAFWVALRAWAHAPSPEVRSRVADWLSFTWLYKTRPRDLYTQMVASLPLNKRDPRPESAFFEDAIFMFDAGGHRQAWDALADMHRLARLSGLRGLVLLFDEFEDVIQNLNNIGYEQKAFVNLFRLFSGNAFPGHSYFAVTPDFAMKCRARLESKFVYDFPVDRFDDLERIDMSPVTLREFKVLARKIRAVHGVAYGWDAASGLPDDELDLLCKRLYAARGVDQVRQAVKGLVQELDGLT